MRSSILAIVALGGSWVSAQNFGAEPSCAIPCLTSAISVAGCQPEDEGCQCGTGISAIQAAVATCLLSACNQSDLAVAASVGLGLCSSYSASLASASAVTTASSHSSSAVVTTTSSLPVSTTSVTAVTTSVAATTSAPSTSSKASSSAKSSSSSAASSSSSAPAPVSTNAAPAIMAGVGGLMGVAAAFVAAL